MTDATIPFSLIITEQNHIIRSEVSAVCLEFDRCIPERYAPKPLDAERGHICFDNFAYVV